MTHFVTLLKIQWEYIYATWKLNTNVDVPFRGIHTSLDVTCDYSSLQFEWVSDWIPQGEINTEVIPSYPCRESLCMCMERRIEGQQQRRSVQVMINLLLLLLDRTPHSERSLSVSPFALSLSLLSSTQNWHTAKSDFRSIPSQFALCGLHFIPLSRHFTIPGCWPAPFVHPTHPHTTPKLLAL